LNLLKQIHIGQKNIINFIKERRTIKLLHLFRSYSAIIVVISSALLVSATNIYAGKESSGFIFGYLGSTENNDENPLEKKLFINIDKQKGIALAPIAQASNSPDPQLKEEEETSLVTMQGQALIAGTSPVRKDPKEDDGVDIYEIQQGDTINAIALRFKISVNTILWANEIDDINSIMPGDKIFILPTSGLNYVVKKNDTIDSISEKYKANKEKIISFNDLPANGELRDGQEIIIPDGQKEVVTPPATQNPTPNSSSSVIARPYESFDVSGKKVSAATGNGHSFPYGYCTWYVASKKHVPWSGNAGTWLYRAKSMGYATGKAPKVGAIMVSSESWWGHVGIVESVKGNEFTISEMNFKGFAKKSTRTISVGNRVIKGFIY
jgi:surface antigen